MKEREYMLTFVDGKASFINEVQISKNIKFEQRDKYLFCDNAILGHTGGSEYYDHELGGLTNKVVKINKFDTDLLDNDSIDTIIGKPITVMHPRDNNGKVKFVDGSNFKEYEIGTVLNAWRDGDKIMGKLVIKDADAIMDILDGKLKALSLGYNANIEKIGDNEYKQKDFYFNHLALVPQGRAVNAQIVDEDVVGKENSPMNIWEKIKGLFVDNEAKFDEETKTIEFADDKHITKRYRVVEETDTYDDETGESENVIKTEEVTKHIHAKGNGEPVSQVIGDEEGVVKEEPKIEEPIKVADEEVVEEVKEVEKTQEEEPVEENKEELEGTFGDESMTKEQIDLIKAELKAELLADISKGKDVFGDINPITNQDVNPKQSFELDFDRDEALRKEMYSLATDPTRHDGDFVKLNETRKNLFK